MMQNRSTLKSLFLLALFVAVLFHLPSCDDDGIPNSEKVAVLITGWGMPQGYNFHYAWTTSDYPRIGDRTEEEGDPCKIGHVGEFPYQSHVSMIPWPITFEVEGWEDFYDYHGVYWYDEASNTYLHINSDVPSVPAADIPAGTPITPAVEWVSQNVQSYPPDPRDECAG